MCDTCGCNQNEFPITYKKPGENNRLIYSHTLKDTNNDTKPLHQHAHFNSLIYNNQQSNDLENKEKTKDVNQSKVVQIEQDVLYKNNLLAERNKGYFEAKNIRALNMMSSPGSGKTTLLEKTISDLKMEMPIFIIEGDQQTTNDADRINATGVPVVQINTGNGCHLDAEMINTALKKLDASDNSLLIIENVGNLICPSLFNLGESFRIVVISVTEGDDKPIKYPNMFHTADVCLINKLDLLPYVDFSIEKAKEYALRVNPNLKFFELSAKTGEGMDEWYKWIRILKKI